MFWFPYSADQPLRRFRADQELRDREGLEVAGLATCSRQNLSAVFCGNSLLIFSSISTTTAIYVDVQFRTLGFRQICYLYKSS